MPDDEYVRDPATGQEYTVRRGNETIIGDVEVTGTLTNNSDSVGGGSSVTSVSGTASQIAVEDGATAPVLSFPPNGIVVNNIALGLATVEANDDTTVLTVASKGVLEITGETSQDVQLPVVSTLPETGFQFIVINRSTAAIQVVSSGGNQVQPMASNSVAMFTCRLLTGTDAASWNVAYLPATFGITNSAGANVVPKSDGFNLVASRVTDDGTTIALPVKVTMPFGGDVADPDLYVGSAANLFTPAIAAGNLTGDQTIFAFFGTSANRFSNIQAVIETTDFGEVGIQSLAVTQGESLGPAAFQGVAGNSGTNLLPNSLGFRANLAIYSSGNVTEGIGFQANTLGPQGDATGNFVDFIGFDVPDQPLAPDNKIYSFRSNVDGAGNFQLSIEGDAPNRISGNLTVTADPSTGVVNLNASSVNVNSILMMPAIVTNSSPTTGQTVSAGTAKRDETLYITPAGTLLALTIELPASASSRVGQIVRGFISQIITGLTVQVAGSGTIVGSTPVTSAVNSTFAYQCVSVSDNGTWIRIQ